MIRGGGEEGKVGCFTKTEALGGEESEERKQLMKGEIAKEEEAAGEAEWREEPVPKLHELI